ncbi:hypothetical protein DFJ74DRAFT_660178 [Hyaloraphidium curvatum]|nr:hypothetical protein DFJ74DRAFT_660178 [Hyaloraphidium curvatum]
MPPPAVPLLLPRQSPTDLPTPTPSATPTFGPGNGFSNSLPFPAVVGISAASAAALLASAFLFGFILKRLWPRRSGDMAMVTMARRGEGARDGLGKEEVDELFPPHPPDPSLLGENEDCPVCLQKLLLTPNAPEGESGEETAEWRTLPCAHFFHSACCAGWLEVKAECPVCRRNVLLEKEEGKEGEVVEMPVPGGDEPGTSVAERDVRDAAPPADATMPRQDAGG